MWPFNMESGTSDLTVVSNQDGDESSMVLDPSIQASLQRTSSSVASENMAAGDDVNAGMEPSFAGASSKNSEIIEAEDDPSPGREPSLQTTSPMLDPAEDDVNAGMEPSFAGASSKISEIIEAEADPSPGMEPSLQTTSSMLDPAEDKQSSETGSTSSPEMEANPFMKHLSGINDNRVALAKHCSELKCQLKNGLQKKAVHAFLKHNDMTKAQEKVQELFYLFEAIEFVISIGKSLYTGPFLHDNLQEYFKADHLRVDIYYWLFIHALSYTSKLRENPSNGLIVANLFEYFEATDFMVFLINKVQEEEDLIDPSLALQEAKTFVNKCVHRYEKETISTFICLVLNDKDGEAEDLFERLLKHMKPNDVTNRGRVYNYALREAQDLRKVHKFLSSSSLSQRYRDVVQCNDRLTRLAMESDNQVKVQRFLVDFYLRDVAVKQEIDWEFVDQHDYPHLIQCVWECHKRKVPNDVQLYNWTPIRLKYVFTSSAAIDGGQIIMKHLLEACPTLDVNASYEGVAALHIAAFKGNEEMIKFLFLQKGFDINVCTGQLPIEKKRNTNRWNFPTYQTALHIATTQRHAKAVRLLCDAPEPHQQRLRCHEEDEAACTPLDILYGGLGKFGKVLEYLEIEKILLSKQDVQAGIDRLYRNRQVLVDAVNTILVGAALIAGVTFVGWIQPPLGYAQYYDLAVPYPAPPGTYDSYLAVQGNLGVKAFTLFNSLSFFFAIATVIVGADAAFPQPTNKYIKDVVQVMHLLLRRAIILLIISLVCVLGAFGSAAIVVLPPSLFFRKDLALSIIIGGGICGFVLWQLLSRHSARVQRLNASIRHIVKFTKVF